MTTVCIRDVQTRRQLDVSSSIPVRRVPWEMSHVLGPCQLDGDLVHYRDESGEQVARTRTATAGECKPGDVVLVQYEESTAQDPSVWWLCEVCALDGSNSTHA